MPNLNEHDLILFKSKKFVGFEKFLESKYLFKILSTEYPPYISFTSKKAILYTNKGAFFLKEKPEYSTNELSLKKSFLFQQFAAKKLDIVPKIRMTDGGNYYINWKGKLYFLTDYRKGRVFNGSDDDVKSMLNALGNIQIAGNKFFRKKDLPRNVLDRIESYEVAKLTPLIKKYIDSKKESEIYKRIIDCLDSLKSEYLKIQNNEYIMSHSDFIVFNLIFDNKGVIALNDFDNAKVLPRFHDLAEFLVSSTMLNYVGSVTNLKLPVLLKPQMNKLNIILKTYLDDFRLTTDNFKLLAIIAEIVWLWTLCLSVLKGDYKILDLDEAVTYVEERKLSMEILNMVNNLQSK